jgi:hypothetical protein
MSIFNICIAAYLLVIITEWVLFRDYKRFLFELMPLAALTAIAMLLSQAQGGYIEFGQGSGSTTLIMFAAILLGIAARYIFYLQGQFVWLDFVKPLCISPLLMIPLIASMQGVKEFQPIQMVSFALLAFQNGFFWQAVLQRSRAKNKKLIG